MFKKIIFSLLFTGLVSVNAKAELNFDKTNVCDYIKTYEITGKITEPSLIFIDYYETSGIIGIFYPGDEVIIICDRSTEWYYVRGKTKNETGWIKAQGLDIPDDTPASDDELTAYELEQYANCFNFKSGTGFYVITDIQRQKTYIFEGSEKNWKHIKTLPCSTGRNVSPTITGDFILKGRGEWFYSERLGSGGMYWIRFSGAYMFHSVAMDKDKNIIDGTVSEKRSNGCIRLRLDDAQWFYNFVPDGTPLSVR